MTKKIVHPMLTDLFSEEFYFYKLPNVWLQIPPISQSEAKMPSDPTPKPTWSHSHAEMDAESIMKPT